jgi:hypothetical protein
MKHLSLSFFTLCAVLLLGACGGGGKNPGFGGGSPAVTLAPTTLTFDSQIQGTVSTAQPVTLTNSGTVPLSIVSVAASANYAVDSTACPATLAAGANCIVNVTFAPVAPATGTVTGTIAFTDNASNSPQTVTLTGTATGV